MKRLESYLLSSQLGRIRDPDLTAVPWPLKASLYHCVESLLTSIILLCSRRPIRYPFLDLSPLAVKTLRDFLPSTA